MKYSFIFLFAIVTCLSCNSKIYLVNTENSTNLNLEGVCKELNRFVPNNVFYVETDNSYLLAESFSSILTYRYGACLGQLDLDKVKILFGKPSCETSTQVCYYLYQKLPSNTSNEYIKQLKKLPKPSMTFTLIDKKIRLGGKCNCEK